MADLEKKFNELVLIVQSLPKDGIFLVQLNTFEISIISSFN